MWYAAAAKSLQSRPTPCDPIDGSPPGSPIPGILQVRTLEWVAISFSNAWKWKVKGKLLSRVRLLATPWTEAYKAPPSMGFSRQEYWSGVPSPSPNQMLISREMNQQTVVHSYSELFLSNRKNKIGSLLVQGGRAENTCLSPPGRVPKLQLVDEQWLTRGC